MDQKIAPQMDDDFLAPEFRSIRVWNEKFLTQNINKNTAYNNANVDDVAAVLTVALLPDEKKNEKVIRLHRCLMLLATRVR